MILEFIQIKNPDSRKLLVDSSFATLTFKTIATKVKTFLELLGLNSSSTRTEKSISGARRSREDIDTSIPIDRRRSQVFSFLTQFPLRFATRAGGFYCLLLSKVLNMVLIFL
ncbi:hypothetical protein KSP39_PZI018637 [Platanthera zijinensis]|uniref:Uncharacterized protein n=1 Tax=Platanthera zijinensis TaxID=2320716 RepID=A0AAP0FYJ1_9ASPA